MGRIKVFILLEMIDTPKVSVFIFSHEHRFCGTVLAAQYYFPTAMTERESHTDELRCAVVMTDCRQSFILHVQIEKHATRSVVATHAASGVAQRAALRRRF